MLSLLCTKASPLGGCCTPEPVCVDNRAFWQPLADVLQAYFVRGNDKRAQLNEVLDAFNIQVFFWLVASGQCVHCFGLAH